VNPTALISGRVTSAAASAGVVPCSIENTPAGTPGDFAAAACTADATSSEVPG
jgi:hypothetical protein